MDLGGYKLEQYEHPYHCKVAGEYPLNKDMTAVVSKKVNIFLRHWVWPENHDTAGRVSVRTIRAACFTRMYWQPILQKMNIVRMLIAVAQQHRTAF